MCETNLVVEEIWGGRPRQLSLPGLNEDGGSVFSDPASGANKTAPVHRWVPWIAGFSAAFVREALRRHLQRPGAVLDPFSGVGTTLVEAALHGHDGIGFEINPYAALACRAKAGLSACPVGIMTEQIVRLRDFWVHADSPEYIPSSKPPAGFKTRVAFYSDVVLRKVLAFHDFIDTIDNAQVRDLFRLAFASTMVRYSNYSYEPSLGTRVAAGKEPIEDFPVAEAIFAKLQEMLEDVRWFREKVGENGSRIEVINDSFFEYKAYLAGGSVNLIVTSPPYLNNYHYNRNTRPQLYWLGYVERPRDLKPLARSNFGKYWQTVRDQGRIELAFSLPSTDLEQRLEALRNTNQNKGVYGGQGWANYAASYFNDCLRFATGIKYALRAGGVALVVIGNSILQGIPIPTDRYFASIAESVGLELIAIHVPRAARVGNSIIHSEVRVARPHRSQKLYEAVVELRNP
jgi:hypothetical protein